MIISFVRHYLPFEVLKDYSKFLKAILALLNELVQCFNVLSAFKGMTLPRTINKITVDSVKWQSMRLPELFRLACNDNQSMTVLCMRTQLVDLHWQKCFLGIES